MSLFVRSFVEVSVAATAMLAAALVCESWSRRKYTYIPPQPADVPLTANGGQDQVLLFGVAGDNARMTVDEHGVSFTVPPQVQQQNGGEHRSINRVTFGVAGDNARLDLSGPAAAAMIDEVKKRAIARM